MASAIRTLPGPMDYMPETQAKHLIDLYTKVLLTHDATRAVAEAVKHDPICRRYFDAVAEQDPFSRVLPDQNRWIIGIGIILDAVERGLAQEATQ